jgi:hypothetical protein
MRRTQGPHPLALPARTLAVFLLFGCLTSASIAAQSILLVTQEDLLGKPASPPLQTREGLAAGLFQAGCIVFEKPGMTAATTGSDALAAARGVGADFLLIVATQFSQAPGDARTYSSHTSYRLVDAAKGATIIEAAFDGSNKDREGSIDRSGLAREIGGLVVEKVLVALRDGAAGS